MERILIKSPNFHKEFENVTRERAHQLVDKFEDADIPTGTDREWLISGRADSPSGDRVNVRIRLVKEKKPRR